MPAVHGRIRNLTAVFLVIGQSACLLAAVPLDEIDLQHRIDPERVVDVNYQLSIQGTLSTPAANGNTDWALISSGRFEFLQRQFASANPGPTGLRAARQFDSATATTTVGKDHRTTNQLPTSQRLIQAFGSDSTVTHVSPDVRLARKHVDLLQLPCDPIVANALLPTRALQDSSEKWNADAWVLPMLIGLDGVVRQTISCEAVRTTDAEAVVAFSGEAEGAVAGAAVKAQLSGRFTYDRDQRLIREFHATLKQQRTPGVVSPGLDVTVEIHWTQVPAGNPGNLPDSMPATMPDDSQLLLSLATPWRLILLHNRNWHVFHETADLLMLRLLDHGALIGQCNIAPSPTVPPGSFTDEQTYRSDVLAALTTRAGTITQSDVSTTESGWRIHHVRAESRTKPPESSKIEPETVYWDYYLCSWKTGEQFSLVFTHTESDSERFGDAAQEILATLVVRQNSPRLPLPR